MGLGAIGGRFQLGLLALYGRWQALRARLYASVLWRWRFNRGKSDRLLLAPQDLRSADPTRAQELADGHFTFAGKTMVIPADVSPFLIAPPSAAWREALFGFTWLRHLRVSDSARGRALARALVGDFVRSTVRFTPEALEPGVTARRLLSWLSQSPLALEGADRGFYRAFLRSLSWQANYLLKAGKVGPDGITRLLCAVATAQASLCLADAGRLRRNATRWLTEELDRQILPDGVHVSRNPNVGLELLLDLLPLRQSFAARNILPPPPVMVAIDRLMPMLRFFRHADGALATFNGMGYTQTHLIATLLAYDDSRGKPVQNAPHGGYQRVEAAGSTLIVDAGKPPPLAMSQEAHAGTLAFEFSADHARIIVNCGAPMLGRESWRQVARTTAAHSTVVVADASSSRFGPAGRGGERSILTGPRSVTVDRRDTEDGTVLSLGHDGYRSAFGLIHARELRLDPEGALHGRDALLDRNGAAWRGAYPVTLRFHAHPAVAVRPAGGDTQAILTLPNGRMWIFHAGGVTLGVEESIHFANPEGPRRSSQIVVVLSKGSPDGEAFVSWSLVPAGGRPSGEPT